MWNLQAGRADRHLKAGFAARNRLEQAKLLPDRRRHRHHADHRASPPPCAAGISKSRLHYAVKSRGDAAYLDELSALLGDRLIVHASDEGARLDLDATFRALPHDAIAVMCGPMRMLEAARRAWNDAGTCAGRSALRDVRLQRPAADRAVPRAAEGYGCRARGAAEQLDARRAERRRLRGDVRLPARRMRRLRHRRRRGRRRDRSSRRLLQRSAEAGQPQDLPLRSRAIGVVTIDTLYRPEAT